MNRGTPMKRTGFATPARLRRERAEAITPEFQEAWLRSMSPVPRGSYGPAKLTAQPKTVARRNPQLLAMAAGRPCLLRVPGVCNGDPETTVACHSNLSIHEKGGHRKADDCYSVWGCARCHTWLDSSYSATGAQRAQRFMGAHLQQVLAWRRIAEDAAAPEADRKAAQWALDQLNATPVAQDGP